MQAYEIYQEMSHDVYKLKNGGALTNISGSGGETWVLEKTYSSDKSMAKTDPNNKSGTENIQTGDGYAGAIYRNDKTGEVIVVNAGTQSRTDLVVDAQMAIGFVPQQYNSAQQIMQDAIALAGNTGTVSVTGHSLGGSLSQLQALEFGVPAVTFNAYGVGNILDSAVSSNVTLQAMENLRELLNETLYPNLFAGYRSGDNASQIVNFKMGDDLIGNAGNDIGVDVRVSSGSGSILGSNLLGSAYTLTTTSGSLLSEHGIALFGFSESFTSNLSRVIGGGSGIPLDIFNNFTRGQYDPLIIDLDGDGVETVGLDKKVLFDHSNDGTKNGTGWVGKDDGLLVLDRNNNGSIDNGGELFGDNTVLKNGQKAKNSYDALADIDGNKDGVLDSKDTDFAKLKIWQDANQDGISQASELKTLAELNIASIKTGAENSTETKLADGNTLAATSSFTRTDGTTGKTGAVNFIADETTRQFTTKIDTSKVAGLPDMQASGNVRDLREAAALSTDLATKLSNYIAAGNNRSTSDLDAIVKAWAATSSVATLASTLKPGAHPYGGRGTNLTQAEINKFNVIEKFSGYYGGVANFIDPSDAQDGRTDGRYSGTYYGLELDAAGINRAYEDCQIVNLSA